MPSHVQSVLFSRQEWTIEKALRWLESHNYKSSKVDITDRYLRFRQKTPDYKKYHYRIHRIGDGITLELGFPGAE